MNAGATNQGLEPVGAVAPEPVEPMCESGSVTVSKLDGWSGNSGPERTYCSVGARAGVADEVFVEVAG